MMDDTEVEELIQRAVEGLLTPSEAAQLEAAASKDPGVARRFAEIAWLHGELAAEASNLPGFFAESADEAVLEAIATVNPWHRVVVLVAIAAAAVLCFYLGRWGQPVPAVPVPVAAVASAPKAVALLVEAENCHWAASELPTVPGSPLPPGMLDLAEGIATIRFTNGAELVMEAPSHVDLLSDMHLRLMGGSVVMDIPEAAHGFTVETRDGKVIDHGTRFGVTMSDVMPSRVWVFKGEVEIQGNKDGGKGRRLLEGQSTEFGAKPEMHDDEALVRRSSDLRPGWISLVPAKDTFVRQGNGAQSANAPLIMVKHSSVGINNNRVGYLSFDLQAVDLTRVQKVELTLEQQPSGFGFAAYVPDCTFILYGLLDDGLDDWSEAGLTPATAPAYNPEAVGVNTQLLKPLAQFVIPRGIAVGTISVGSPALLEFLRADVNKVATFLIVRETDESNKEGLVHAFASREHPTAAPPRLHLKMETN